jgi:hypothetical protein
MPSSTVPAHAVDIIYAVCGIAGSLSFLDDVRTDAKRAGLVAAIRSGHTPRIFDWALENFSYQGISDQVARNYLAKHGTATWQAIKAGLSEYPSCSKLQSYWQFDRCRYDKGSFSCSEPERMEGCPLPRHQLRNGRLNQTAYSFFLFVRDIAQTNLVGWIDGQLSSASGDLCQEAIIGPLRHVYGVSDKILTMTLSGLLMADPSRRPLWFEAGKNMIAVDTLVHNFLHRTGVLANFGASHPYGFGCYAADGCADIIRSISAEIDATTFNRQFPKNFPRFVQHAIWRYCAGDGLNICNGNRIDDRKSCENSFCQLFRICQKMTLKSQ